MFDPLRTKMKVLLYVALAFLVGVGTASGLGWTRDAVATPVIEEVPQVPVEAVQPARDLSEAFVRVAEVVTPAVVSITTRRVVQSTARDPFRNWFGVPDPEPRSGSGSGFLVSSDGYILTNNHVVEDADEIRVQLEDRRTFEATLVGGDPTTDVAVIKVEGSDLPTLSLGDSDEARVGEWVLAVGNPGYQSAGGPTSFNHTVTAGIVSFKGRPLGIIGSELRNDPESQEAAQFAIEDFIQTDAVINPGNSGGPMVNLRGQVIGINAAIVSRTGAYQGYGFAIPMDLAHRVMEDLIAHGRVRRAYMGVSIDPVGEADAERFGLPEVAGALIQNVTRNAPAERAGLQDYDVITALDGDKVLTGNDLQHKIALRAPGDPVRVTVYRDGQPRDVTVQLGEAPFMGETTAARPTLTEDANQIGIVDVLDIDREIARQLRLESTDGVIVREVQEGGPAIRRGLGTGCAIREVDGRAIDDSRDWENAFKGVEEGDVVSVIAACGQQQAGETVYRMYNIRVPR
jgi:serine protease Do